MGLTRIATGYIRESKSGKSYINLKLAGVYVMLFRSDYKDDSGNPKYTAMVDEDDAWRFREEQTPPTTETPSPQHREESFEDDPGAVPF